MRKLRYPGLTLLVVLLILLVACAPQAAPTPAAPATPVPTTLAAPVPAAPTVTPEEAAWQQVIKAARQEGKVVIYSPSALAGDPGRIVAKAFKDQYGVSLEALIMPGPAYTDKLQVEARMGQHVADVTFSGSVSAPRLALLGLVQDMSKDLPVLKDQLAFSVPPVYSPEGQVLIYGYLAFATVVNSKLVKPGEIQSYYDLLDPKWKGKTILIDPRLGASPPMLTITQMRMDKILDDAYFHRLAEQKPDLRAGSSLEPVNMVARGEFAINFEASDPLFINVLKEGGPIRVLHMKEGTIVMPNTIMANKNAPHPNATRLFLNWFLSMEGQTVFHKASASTSLRKDVPDFIHPGAREDPIKKLLLSTWQHALKTLEEVNAGVMDKFFGKR